MKEPLRSQALAVIDLIAEDLCRRPIKRAYLGNGAAGLAILFDCLAEARPTRRDWHPIALRFLDQATDAVAARRMPPSFLGGFTGVAWAVAHLKGRGSLDSRAEDSDRAIDGALKVYLSHTPWKENYDLVRGLVGFGIYALERLPQPSAIDCLTLIVKRLGEIAERSGGGVTWHTAPELLSKIGREDAPLGYYDLGLPHGVPGVIVLLAQVCAVSDKCLKGTRAKARELLEGAVTWLLKQTADRSQSYPFWVGPGISPMPGPLGWWYGDLAIASALLTAAHCLKQAAWKREALRIGHRAARRPAEEAGVIDTGLCFGTAGVGHLFNRLFQATGERRFSAAARFWFGRTLAMRRPKKGIAGFVACRPGPRWPNEKRWVAASGILQGVAGIALALLSAATPLEPAWDRLLLLSRRNELA